MQFPGSQSAVDDASIPPKYVALLRRDITGPIIHEWGGEASPEEFRGKVRKIMVAPGECVIPPGANARIRLANPRGFGVRL